MLRGGIVVLALTLVLCGGCKRAPEYGPPIQRDFGEAPARIARVMAEMSAADAETYIVSGVLGAPAGAPWRWTLQRAELNFELDRTDGWKLVADFVIPDSTFRDTGPVTVSFFINGRLLERVLCASPGKQRLEKPAGRASTFG